MNIEQRIELIDSVIKKIEDSKDCNLSKEEIYKSVIKTLEDEKNSFTALSDFQIFRMINTVDKNKPLLYLRFESEYHREKFCSSIVKYKFGIDIKCPSRTNLRFSVSSNKDDEKIYTALHIPERNIGIRITDRCFVDIAMVDVRRYGADWCISRPPDKYNRASVCITVNYEFLDWLEGI